jgi:regulator of protease activity HflC (stomatin/prohibitin superfamily)
MATNVGLVIAVVIGAIFVSSGLHSVREGYVGVYWRGGALLSSTSGPGFHVKFPIVTSVEEVQVTVQTDAVGFFHRQLLTLLKALLFKVTGIPCGTSGGVMIQFGICVG